MSDATRLLNAAASGDREAAARLAAEPAGHTLQPTALVHEAYLRLIGPDHQAQRWDGRGHFFAAAAEAMRRILVDAARQRRAAKRGGHLDRQNLDDLLLAAPEPREDLIALDEALARLAEVDPVAARLVDLRYFAGLSIPEAAAALEISPRSADRLWAFARAWLRLALADPPPEAEEGKKNLA